MKPITNMCCPACLDISDEELIHTIRERYSRQILQGYEVALLQSYFGECRVAKAVFDGAESCSNRRIWGKKNFLYHIICILDSVVSYLLRISKNR